MLPSDQKFFKISALQRIQFSLQMTLTIIQHLIYMHAFIQKNKWQ